MSARRNDRRPRLLAAGDRAYHELLAFIPDGKQNNDWAKTRNNMAIVIQTIGERSTNTEALEEAAAIISRSS